MRPIGIMIFLMLIFYGCKTSSTQQTSKNIPAHSRMLPIIDFNALEYLNVYSPFNAFHREEGGEPLKDIMIYYLKNRLPEYQIQLSESDVAYYYAFSCSGKAAICECIFPLKPKSLGFLLIQSSKISTVLNVNYKFEYNWVFDNLPTIYTMEFEIDKSGLIYLTQEKKWHVNWTGADSIVYTFKQRFKILPDRVDPAYGWNYLDLNVRTVSKEDISSGKVLLPELEQANYFAIDTRFNRYLQENCTDSVAQYLKNILPKYVVFLSDSIKAYYYSFECGSSQNLLCGACFVSSFFNFFVIESSKEVTILNIGFNISHEGVMTDLRFDLDELGTIYLTEWETGMSEDHKGNEFVRTHAYRRHIIKALQDSIIHQEYYINEE